MNVCTQCGKENIPVIPPPEKCPHEYEIELQAADELAKAGSDAKRLCPEKYKDDIVLNNVWHALTAYEKLRGLK